jgi:hypothetical protein
MGTIRVTVEMEVDGDAQEMSEPSEGAESMLYLLQYNGHARVVGEDDNWSVAYEMTGETGRLFAAAPALLEALRAMRDAFTSDGTDDQHNACLMADAAIAKAEERSE